MIYFVEYKIDSFIKFKISPKYFTSLWNVDFFCFLMHLQAVWNFVNVLCVPFVFIYLWHLSVSVTNCFVICLRYELTLSPHYNNIVSARLNLETKLPTMQIKLNHLLMLLQLYIAVWMHQFLKTHITKFVSRKIPTSIKAPQVVQPSPTFTKPNSSCSEILYVGIISNFRPQLIWTTVI